MKKKFTYGLLVLVLVLWGIIFYRLFSKETPDSTNLPVETSAVTPVKDTVISHELIADYRDPFFKTAEVTVAKEEVIETTLQQTVAAEAPVEPIPVSYAGVIENSSNNKQIVILDIGGRDVMFSEGETHYDVTFLKNFDNYIQILYHGKIETIYK